jgi:NADPH-dependent 2,4-dienoyl-CoA reductase/sulfur reductase-like enzyme
MRLLVVGGSDAGIQAGLRALERDPTVEATVLVADRYPNYSICGIPYHVAGEVADWHDLAHRSQADLTAAELDLRLEHRVVRIDPAARRVDCLDGTGATRRFGYDQLVVATGALPARPPIGGLDRLGPAEGVHTLHTIGDTLALTSSLDHRQARRVVIVGAGYIGMEMAEALRTRGLEVTVLERLGQVLPATIDPEVAAELAATLDRHDVRVHTGTPVQAVSRSDDGGDRAGLLVHGPGGARWRAEVVLVVTGVRPDSHLAAQAGLRLGVAGAITVDRRMRTSAPGVLAAGDCVVTYHRLLEADTWLPLGTTAHKQGRVAGETATGGHVRLAGSLGTQVVRVFDRVVAATGLRGPQAAGAGFDPVTVAAVADDHKAYYPGATPLQIRLTGDRRSGRLLGAQLLGQVGAEIAKRIDILATAIAYGASVAELGDLDLSYTPPLGSPWDAIQHAAHAWLAHAGSQPATRPI